MRTPLSGQLEPMRPRGPQCFVDWRYVEPDMVAWKTANKRFTIFDDPPPETFGKPGGPSGIRLEAQRAELVGPIFPLDQPWETNYNMYFATVLYEEGVYRAWYTCIPPDSFTNPVMRKRWVAHQVVCYAESDDGFNWRKPKLREMAYGSHEETNIVYGQNLSPNGFQSGSVFKDPHAPADERYKLFYLGETYPDNFDELKAAYQQRFNNDIDPLCFASGKPHHYEPHSQEHKKSPPFIKMMAGAVSPDGLHWTPIREPLMAQYGDTLNTASWDETLGRYVAYVRTWRYGRRCVGRAETTDFRHWPETPDTILEAPLDWPASDDIYTNSKLLYPGTTDVHLMFPGVFHRFDDGRDVYMASSVDGYSWKWVPGGPAVARGDLNSWCAGDLNPGVGLVPLSGDRIALPVMGYHEPHKFPRGGERPLGTPGWATWLKGRISALVAGERGEFSTPDLIFEGRELSLNLKTTRAGIVEVELRDERGAPIPGYSFAEADPIVCDSLDRRVTWQGRADLREYAGRPVSLGFRLRLAHLFGFEFIA